MIRRPKVRLALTESDLLERLHRALESADVEVEILPTKGENQPAQLGSVDADVLIVAPTDLSDAIGELPVFANGHRNGNGHKKNGNGHGTAMVPRAATTMVPRVATTMVPRAATTMVPRAATG